MTIFLVVGALQIAPSLGWFSWLPWTSNNLAIQIIVTIAGLVLITYTGFTLSVVKAIPFWNTALLPIIFLVYSILGGAGLALVMLPLEPGIANVEHVEETVRWLLIIVPVLLAIYLWGGYSSVSAARRSVFELLRGSISLVFIGGVVVLGLAIPLALVGYSFFVTLPYMVLVVAAICEFIGGLLARYSILKALEGNRTITASGIARIVHCDRNTTHRHLRWLQKAGKVTIVFIEPKWVGYRRVEIREQ